MKLRIASLIAIIFLSTGVLMALPPAAPQETVQAEPPIVSAAKAGDVAKIQTLLASGAKADTRDSYGVTPLMGAAAYGHLEAVKLLLANKADANAFSNGGYGPLQYASRTGHLDIVKLLVESKANVNAESKEAPGETPLYNASRGGHPDIAVYLLDRGATVNVADKEFKSPLFWAASKQKPEVVRLLLQRGADGTDALLRAAMLNDGAAVKALLAGGVSINAQNAQGETALIEATRADQLEMIALLLAGSANPNLAIRGEANMTTPLMEAAYNCSAKAARLLLDHGADRNARNPSGDTAYDLASSGWTSNMKACSTEVTALLAPR